MSIKNEDAQMSAMEFRSAGYIRYRILPERTGLSVISNSSVLFLIFPDCSLLRVFIASAFLQLLLVKVFQRAIEIDLFLVFFCHITLENRVKVKRVGLTNVYEK